MLSKYFFNRSPPVKLLPPLPLLQLLPLPPLPTLPPLPLLQLLPHRPHSASTRRRLFPSLEPLSVYMTSTKTAANRPCLIYI